MSEQTHQLRLMQARLLSEHWQKQAEAAEASIATLTARCEALEKSYDELAERDSHAVDAICQQLMAERDALLVRCEALEQEKAQMLAALRKVPLFGLTKDALGWRCAGCGSVSGIHRDGRTREEACVRDCYVPVVEAAINRAEGK